MLLAGTNTLKILSTATTNDVSLFDKVKVTYQRRYSAVNNQLTFNTQNYKISKVEGFTDANVRLFDITEDGSPVLMTNLAATPSGQTFMLNIPAARSRLFQAVSDAGSRPFEVSKSSTGMRSPDVTMEFWRNQLASLPASFGTVSGFAKWYEPTARPAACAPARFVQ